MPDPVLTSDQPPLVSPQQVSDVFAKMMPTKEELAASKEAPTKRGDEAPFEAVTDPVKEPVKEVVVKEPEPAKDEHPEDIAKLPAAERKNAWKALRDQYHASKKELDGLKTQLTDFDGTKKERDELKARIETLSAEREELTKIDSISKLENHPDFRAKYVTGRQQAVDKLAELAGYADIDAKELISTLSLTGKDRFTRLSDAIAGAPDVLKGKIVALHDQIESIDADRAKELADAGTTIQRRESERNAREQTIHGERVRAGTELFDSTAGQIGKEWGIAPETIAKAKAFFLTNDNTTQEGLKEAVLASIKGYAADPVFEHNKKLAAELKELKAELVAFQESDPGVRSGSQEHGATGDEGLGFIGAIKKTIHTGGVARA